MSRYWVSWYAQVGKEGVPTPPPFQYFITGRTDISGDDRDECTICAVFDADNASAIREVVAQYFPDFKERFLEKREPDWHPGNRFPDARAYTILAPIVTKEAVLDAISEAFDPGEIQAEFLREEAGRVFGTVTIIGSESFLLKDDIRRQQSLWVVLGYRFGSNISKIGPIVLEPMARPV